MRPLQDIRDELAARYLVDDVRRVATEYGTTVDALCIQGDRVATRARAAFWIVLRETYGLSYFEVARLFGVHITSVQGAVARARSRVRKAAADAAEEELELQQEAS